MKLLLNLIGIVVILGLIFLLSWDRRNIQWKTVLRAILIQFIIAVLLVKVPIGKTIVSVISDGVTAIINCGQEGLSFVFGSLADSASLGGIFIVQTLGNIIFVSALVSLLYYIGVLGFVVKWIGKGVGKLMGTTEVESFVAVANMFLG
ncbi:MAG: NupC/NupG family nucleoside CNT transporter, partial [Lachnospiraceae bacterium]|nr:NupC/NupG family nucleoside CNT transporter [Lachnospiraceae bacterium]